MEPPTIEEPWKADFVPDVECLFSMEKGVYKITQDSKEKGSAPPSDAHFPPLAEFVSDMQLMCAMIADGPL